MSCYLDCGGKWNRAARAVVHTRRRVCKCHTSYSHNPCPVGCGQIKAGAARVAWVCRFVYGQGVHLTIRTFCFRAHDGDWMMAAAVLSQYGCDGWVVDGTDVCLNRNAFRIDV